MKPYTMAVAASLLTVLLGGTGFLWAEETTLY